MEEQNQKRVSFFKGLFLGVFLTVIIVGSLFSVTVLFQQKKGSAENKDTTASAVVKDSSVQKKLSKIAGIIDKYYIEDVDPKEIETYLYKGLVAGVDDPYSTYYSKEELNSFMESTSGVYSGIGVTMQYDATVNMVQVASVNEKGPAAEVDIRVGDYVYKVDGKEYPLENADMTELVSHVRGEEGTTVELTLLRGSNKKEVKVTVERRAIETETVTGQMLDDQIGYIRIVEFDTVTTSQFETVYENLKQQGAKGLILDLRANPGGQVDVVVKIAEKFVPEGIITYMEDKQGNRQDFYGKGNDIWDKPLVVLIDGNSASASEIFAGAVRDYKKGTLMGTKTYGKGIVQQTVNLGDQTALKLTFAKYYTPNGENIHGTGIQPDIEVEYKALEEGQQYQIGTDNQIQEAQTYIKKEMAE